ncbi:MAG TPA: phospho-N-acetylmuramoyl-pentapeptide-transferase [Solirubrobacteraceae bacterium]|nr:phospho-N-acetylmuramoyl-pentapeptide-transferase [Solirubrobacteraceae bacterium]
MILLAATHALYSQAGRVLISSSAALLMCLFLSPRFIEFLRVRSFGQHIQEELLQHQAKMGTPTMGGIIIVLAFAIPYICLSTHDWASLGVFGSTLACAALGLADDYTKIVKRRSLGLRGRTKMIVLLLISVGLWWIATQKAGLSQSVSLRPLDVRVPLGPAYILFIYLVFAGTTNAVNLTDGLDGLAAGCGAIALLTYIGITYVTGPSDHDLELVAGCMCGACIGFLWFNAFPASVFMGDTGSLAIGGAIAGLAVMTETEILLVVIGGIFVMEALSVIVQVFSFRVFHKRVFKMAPIHHHFAMEAWSETKIMLRFWIVAAACGAIGFTLYQISEPSRPVSEAPPPAARVALPRPSGGSGAGSTSPGQPAGFTTVASK